MSDKSEKPSIYERYSKDAVRRTKTNPLSDLYPKLPNRKFDVIYADPPWDYGGKMQFDKSGLLATQKENPKKVFISAANFKYPTLKLDQFE